MLEVESLIPKFTDETKIEIVKDYGMTATNHVFWVTKNPKTEIIDLLHFDNIDGFVTVE